MSFLAAAGGEEAGLALDAEHHAMGLEVQKTGRHDPLDIPAIPSSRRWATGLQAGPVGVLYIYIYKGHIHGGVACVEPLTRVRLGGQKIFMP